MHCQNCGNTAAVPSPGFVSSAENTVRTSELHHQLKENESQRTEVTSYINQLNIQLHRWQLRLKDLNERQKKLQAELATVSATAAR